MLQRPDPERAAAASASMINKRQLSSPISSSFRNFLLGFRFRIIHFTISLLAARYLGLLSFPRSVCFLICSSLPLSLFCVSSSLPVIDSPLSFFFFSFLCVPFSARFGSATVHLLTDNRRYISIFYFSLPFSDSELHSQSSSSFSFCISFLHFLRGIPPPLSFVDHPFGSFFRFADAASLTSPQSASCRRCRRIFFFSLPVFVFVSCPCPCSCACSCSCS